ncbi:AP2 domain-containing protein [Ralstonia phage RPZH6]|nr:AP2 domain-containing protein [Ralstonia phage RPZH6]
MAEIKTKKGEVILVDDEDFEWLSKWRWWVEKNGYARCRVDGKNVSMHRLILGLTGPSIHADHKNGEKLDNRRDNLRACTISQNTQNRKRNAEKIVPLKGVTPQTSGKGYTARIQCGGRSRHLGTFETAELAHEFYCLAADMLHGEFARHA